MTKWEYCRVLRGMGDEGLTYLGLTTEKNAYTKIKRDKSKGDQDDADAADRFIAELGVSGWEMVGVSNHGYLQWLYFKRPLA